MLKTLIVISLLAYLTACAGGEPDTDAKRSELEELKKEKARIAEKIEQTENELRKIDGYLPIRDKTPVVLQTIKEAPFSHFVEVQGEAYTDQNVNLTPEASGTIKKIFITEGAWVREGEKIMQLDDDLIRRNKAEVETDLQLARDVYQRRKNLWDRNIGSELEYIRARHDVQRLENALQTIETQLDHALIKAPFSGYIDALMMQEGEMATSAQPVARMINLAVMKVRTRISEEYRTRLSGVDSALVSIPAIGLQQKAPVRHIGHIINPGDRTFNLSIELQNNDHEIKPNMLATIMLRDYYRPEAIAIPVHIIRQEGNEQYIYIAGEEEGQLVARKRVITTGKTWREKTEVVSGLSSGDRILTKGYAQVSEGSGILEHKN